MNREKAIKDNAIRGLKSAIEISGALVHLRKEHAKTILELLKEQEAVEPIRDANYVKMFRCGVCGKYVGFIDSYCSNCGRKVKWNDRQRES